MLELAVLKRVFANCSVQKTQQEQFPKHKKTMQTMDFKLDNYFIRAHSLATSACFAKKAVLFLNAGATFEKDKWHQAYLDTNKDIDGNS